MDFALFSITLVLISHSRGLNPPPDSFVFNGKFGVYVFFVLSGYLITRLLLEEENAKGSINLRAFYARRALRILPPALVYLMCVSVLGLVGVFALKPWDIVPCIFFFRNLTWGAFVTGHFWSLSIEEQFYLLWSLTLLLVRRPRSRIIVTLGLILASDFFSHFNPSFNVLSYNALLIGCALALVRFSGARFLQSALVPLASSLAVVVRLSGIAGIAAPRAYTLAVFAVALIVNYVVEHPRGPL